MVWVLSLTILIIGKIKKSTRLISCGWPTFTITTLIAVFILVGLFLASRPEKVFEESFGFPVTEDVTNIKSDYYYLLDSGHTFLMFEASETTVEKIVKTIGFIQVSEPYFPSSNVEPPKWWKIPLGRELKWYRNTTSRDFFNEARVLIYDQETSTVYYHFIGID